MIATTISIKSLVTAAIFSIGGIHQNIPESEVSCLTQAVIYEATSEPKLGKRAIANVIKNRTKSDIFPKTVCAVIKQKSQFSFYPTRKATLKVNNEKDFQNYLESAIISAMVLSGSIKDNTNGSLFFINPKLTRNVAWTYKLKRTMKIGNHVFYDYV